MTAVLLLLLLPLMVVTAFFSIEVIIGLIPLDGCGSIPSKASAVVVVPAHNEAAIIERTLRQLKLAAGKGMGLLVIADNCSDDTAGRASALGVDVIERIDSVNRGKGFALACAMEHLAATPPDVVVVIDADCRTDAASLRALVDSTATSGQPSQAVNLLQANRTAPPMVQISAFAFMVKNLIRQRGLQRLAGRVHLTGTGMALPFEVISGKALASADIVEDLSLGLRLARVGLPARLVPDALVTSSAADSAGTLIQRTRWEGGFLQTALHQAPRLAADGLMTRDLRCFVAAFDLMVPPLALLTLTNLAAAVMTAGLTVILHLSWLPVLLQFSLIALSGVTVVAAWLAHGRPFLTLTALARLPIYLLWKLPLYLSLAHRGAPRDWLRSRR